MPHNGQDRRTRRSHLLYYYCLTWSFLASHGFALSTNSASCSSHHYPACVGRVVSSSSSSDTGVEYLVVGTSHSYGRSACEVEALIRKVRPDGVVVELDPERAIRLTKEGCSTSTSDHGLFFGADLYAAVETARALDVPLFLGDEYTEETRARLRRTALSPATYGYEGLVRSLFLPGGLDLGAVFREDPRKLIPLLASVAPAFLVLAATMVLSSDHQPSAAAWNTPTELATTILSVLVSFFASCKLFNTLIADRDEVLAGNAVSAARSVASLRRGDTIRRTWTFSAEDLSSSDERKTKKRNNNNNNNDRMPLFTLKTPLLPGAQRNLNLFEPRWLSMVDDLLSSSNNDNKTERRFGCVTCTNKFYSAVSLPDGREGRYADVTFHKEGRLATVQRCVEGSRPSGARKVSLQIEGAAPFAIDEQELSVVEVGYLTTSSSSSVDKRTSTKTKTTLDINNAKSDDELNTKTLTIVVVVGLLHANGVVDILSRQ